MWQRRNVRDMKKNDDGTQLNKVVIFRRQRPRVSVQSVSCRSNLKRLTISLVVVWTVVQDRHIVPMDRVTVDQACSERADLV